MNGRHPSWRLGIALALVGHGALAYAADVPPDDPSLISLTSVVIDTRTPVPLPAQSLAVAPDDRAASAYALVKFPGPTTAEQYGALQASVERIYAYLPHFAYLVKLRAAEALNAAPRVAGASWIGPYHPAYKLSPSVMAVAAHPDRAVNAAGGSTAEAALRPVLLQVYPDADLGQVAAALRAVGAVRIVGSQPGGTFSRVRLLLTSSEIVALREALAQVPQVFWIEAEPRRVLLNDTTIWVGQSGLGGGQATPVFDRGLFGEGQVVAVLDTGIDADMCYFRDPARGLPPRNECNGGTVVDVGQRKVLAVDFLATGECASGINNAEWDTQDHGSHVAGTVAGDNFANPLIHNPGDGMAPGAKLVIQDAGFGTDNCADLPALGCPVVDLKPIFQQAYTQGARMHTNSWGDRENFTPQNTYTAGSQDADQFMWDHKDFLLFFAAGNSGPGTGSVGSPSTAKNVVSVGATQRSTAANSIASFSSCGPTNDGRLKPDLTVPGVSIVSANNDLSIATNNCGTKTSSGTSMASPGGAGLAALVRQYFVQGWYPSGAPVAANAFVPSGALVKAAMINSAVNMTGVAAIPSNCQGWGRVLLEQVLHFQGDRRRLWVQDDTVGFPRGAVGQSRTFRFTVTNAEPFKATLAWTDFPSTPAANPQLNNDLDLVVTGPAGTFRGNVFSGGQSTTGGAADRRNTVEQVLIQAPAPGEYTVSAQAFNVPDGPQPFSLVVAGDATPCGTTCGGGAMTVFTDDFEAERGWTVNASGTDTATSGRWERGDPEATNSSGPKQLGNANSGTNDLVTARLAGASAGVNDVDGGLTSVRSPAITLPATGNLTLSFAFYLAHGSNASSADFLRVSVVGTSGTPVTMFQRLGAVADVDAAWQTTSASLNAFAGQTVRILVQAADAGGASLVEAAIDDVRIVQQ